MLKVIKKCYCIWLPLIVTIIGAALHMIRFIVNDDIGLMLVAESFQTNTHSEQLLFMSILYGYLLRFLYQLLPAVNWFLLLELGVLNLGIVTLHRIAQRYPYRLFSATVITLVQLFLLSNLTFTSISFLVISAAMLWYYVHVDKLTKESIKHLAVTLFLFLLGFGMRRDDTFLFTTALFLAVFGLAFLKKKKSLLAVLLVFVISFSANYFMGFTQDFYNRHLENNEYYYELNKVRSDANDGGLFRYEPHADEFEKLGISKNDYRLASHWTFADKNVFNNEVFKAIGEVRTFEEKYNTNLKELSEILKKEETLLLFMVLLILMTVIYFLLMKEGRWEAAAACALSLLGALFIYFRRRGVERVSCPIILCGMLTILILFLMNSASLRERFRLKNKKIGIAIVAVLCAASVFAGAGYNYSMAKVADRKALKAETVVTYVEEHPQALYISDAYSVDKYRLYYANQHIFTPYANRDFKLNSILGGWNLYTAYYYDNLKRLGISEYSESLIKVLLKDDVYFVTKKVKPKQIVRYFNENYDLNVKYTTVQEFKRSGVTIYDFDLED